jgi:hypothetical protein
LAGEDFGRGGKGDDAGAGREVNDEGFDVATSATCRDAIAQVRELQKTSGTLLTTTKKNGKTAMIRGIYCRFCGKELDTKKSQKIFCSQGCAGRWQGQHKGHKPTPRLTLKDEMLGTTVVAGEGVRD